MSDAPSAFQTVVSFFDMRAGRLETVCRKANPAVHVVRSRRGTTERSMLFRSSSSVSINGLQLPEMRDGADASRTTCSSAHECQRWRCSHRAPILKPRGGPAALARGRRSY
jgi:hypothetical protein